MVTPMVDTACLPPWESLSPSTRRFNKWGGANLGSLAAPRPFPQPFAAHTAQRSVSLAFPLSSRPDQIIQAPSCWPHQRANDRVLKYLSGAAADTPRLRLSDRTVHQPALDLGRPTAYAMDFGRPAAYRNPPAVLPPLEKRPAFPNGTMVRPLATPLQTAALDAPYHPSKHGIQSAVKRTADH